MILTKKAILQYIDSGHIVSPPELVQENSVNVRLGEDIWRCDESLVLYNLHASDRRYIKGEPSVSRLYQNGVGPDENTVDVRGFWLMPNRVYIGTTMDEHGTRLLGDGIAFVPEMRARSTTGRHGLTVALCAGIGDVGYAGRWALEIVNNGARPVFVAIGTEIGQVVYHTATEAYPEDAYGGDDRYQKADGAIQFLPKPFKLPEVQ